MEYYAGGIIERWRGLFHSPLEMTKSTFLFWVIGKSKGVKQLKPQASDCISLIFLIEYLVGFHALAGL